MSKLGNRISIYGSGSSVGKSTLAVILGAKYDLPVVHLDQIYHLPTQWIWRPKEEYTALHDAEIQKERWILEGNYSDTVTQRFERSDTIIYIDMNRFGSAYRFIKRHYADVNNQKKQLGRIEPKDTKLSWSSLWYLLQPKIFYKRRRMAMKRISSLLKTHKFKVIRLNSFKQINEFIKQLDQPAAKNLSA